MGCQDSTQSGHPPSLPSCLSLTCFCNPETGHLHGSWAPDPKFHGRVALPGRNRGPSQPRHPRKVLAHGGEVLETQPPPPCETSPVPFQPTTPKAQQGFLPLGISCLLPSKSALRCHPSGVQGGRIPAGQDTSRQRLWGMVLASRGAGRDASGQSGAAVTVPGNSRGKGSA